MKNTTMIILEEFILLEKLENVVHSHAILKDVREHVINDFQLLPEILARYLSN